MELPDQGTGKASLIAGGIVAAAVLLYAALFSYSCFYKYQSFRVDFDLAVHAQSIWNIRHGSLDCSVLGVPFFANHMVPILFLLAPFCSLQEPALSLLLIQSAILALGGWGVFLLARPALPLRWAVGWAILYLVYPPLWYMNLYEFHPVAFVTPFLIFAFHFYREQRFWPFAVFLALALLCQENIGLIAAGFGVLALCQRRKGRWVWAPVITGCLWFFFAVVVIMPRLNQGRMMFSLVYSHLGDSLGQVLLNILRHPLHAASVALRPEKLAFLFALLTPVAFIGLLSPLAFVPLLPVLAQRLLSSRAIESALQFHYQAEFIPFIFAASIDAARRLLAWKGPSAGRVLATVLTAAAAMSVMGSGISHLWGVNLTPAEEVAPTWNARWKTLRRIPPQASVAATSRYLAPLAGRSTLYALYHVYHGCYPLSTTPYPLPKDVEYVVLDAFDPMVFFGIGYEPEEYRHLQALMAQSSWEVAEQLDGFVVFRRAADAASPNAGVVDIVDSESPALSFLPAETRGGDGAIRVVGFRPGEVDGDGALRLTLCWTKPVESARDYDVLLELRDGDRTWRTRVAPGQRIWPPPSWPVGKWVLDRQRIHLENQKGPLREPALIVHLRPIPGTDGP